MSTTPTPDLSRGPVLLAMSIGTASFTFSTTIVRFCVRTRISNDLGADDYAIGAATVVAFIGTIFSLIEATATNGPRALEFDILGAPWFMMGATLSKISICLFFIRLLGSARSWRIPLSVLIFLMAVVNFTCSLTVNLQCRPLEKLWQPSVDGACWDPSVQLNFEYFQGAFSVSSWFFLALFPVMIMRDLEMPGKLRWPFHILSAVSFVAGVFSIARTSEVSQTGGASVYGPNYLTAQVLAVLEQNFGVIAANLLPMGPLFSRSARQIARAKTPGGESTRTMTRSTSRASTRVGTSHGSRPGTSRSISAKQSSFIDLKRSTTLIIEGPRRPSFDVVDMRDGMYVLGGIDPDGRSIRSDEEFDLEAWPNGIIKTVSVEVVEEDNPDHYVKGGHSHSASSNSVGVGSTRGGGSRAGHSAKGSEVSIEQDWETMLRQGPSGP